MIVKKTFAAIASVLMLLVAISMVAAPLAFAHDPEWEIPTWAFVNAEPNPVGVGQ